MQFIKVNEGTLNCLISEQEMDEMGFQLEELISDRNKAQDFLQIVLAGAESEMGFKMKETAALSVEVTMLPGQGISLTISDKGYLMESTMEKIHRFRDAIMEYMRAFEEHKEAIAADEQIEHMFILGFDSLDKAIEYCCLSGDIELESSLYRLKGNQGYYMILEHDFTGEEFRHLGGLAIEFACSMDRSEALKAYILEHGKCIIAEGALERLKMLG